MAFPSVWDDSIEAGAVLPLLLARADPDRPWTAGVPFIYRSSCRSTNTALKDMAGHSPAGTALVTDNQTGGRGRLGRTWLSQPGRDLTFSVLLRPSLDPDRAHLLALATGVAVAEVLEDEYQLREQVSLKWPNDVLLAGKKVCGILLEAAAGATGLLWAAAGVGLNVNSEPGALSASLSPALAAEWERRPRPVSLTEHLGTAVPRAPLLAALLARLTRWWTALDLEEAGSREGAGFVEGARIGMLEEWRRRDALAGRRVEIFSGVSHSDRLVSGEAAGIGEEGQLLIQVAGPAPSGGLTEVFAGDVSVLAN